MQEEAVLLVGYHYLVGRGVHLMEEMGQYPAAVARLEMGLARAVKFAYVFTH